MFTRRKVLALLAGAAASIGGAARVRAAQSAGVCVVRPRSIEGPYFVDTKLNRSDIRSDPKTGAMKQGALLRLTFRVSQMDDGRCFPLQGAQVDVWHCDADGLYSDTKDWQASTVGQQFLRGWQLTDRRGIASFTTIYPGWYPNRAVHIHFKVRTNPQEKSTREFTSQIYFDDELTDDVHKQPAYRDHGVRKVRNNRDVLFLFRGDRLVLPVREDKKGYAGTFDIALE
ncbi:MAG TPA: protocatechuate 3,4-dioxygenase [Burkholderiales bacterium]|nr:protocatechuate 3,4-dioxygenase [Burkholderiales bacterium]